MKTKRLFVLFFLILFLFIVKEIFSENRKTLLSESTVRGPIEAIDASTQYCFYYGEWDECVIKEIKDKFKLVILHPGLGTPYITKDQVRQLQDADVIVIGYISIGEDYIIRPGGAGPGYFDEPNCRIVYENRGYASWYLDEVDSNWDPDHDGIPDKNPYYQTYFVNGGDPQWQEFLKTARLESDGFAGMDYILNELGCNGLFLDTAEIPSPWLPYFYTWRGMSDFITKISELYPEKYIMVNRPLFACYSEFYPVECCQNDPNMCPKFCFCDFNSQDDARDKFRQSINAFVWESYSLDRQYPDFEKTRANVLECSGNSDGMGFNVLVLDYYNLIKDLYPKIKDQIEEVKGLGWLDYIAPGPLDKFGYWVYCHDIRCIYRCNMWIDGSFDDWEYISERNCKYDPSSDISRPNADITNVCIENNRDYLYIMIQVDGKIPDNFYDPNEDPDIFNFYQIFFDLDWNSQGYKGNGCAWKHKFDYLWENGNLWQYVGSGCDWNWKRIEENTAIRTQYAIDNDRTYMEMAIPFCSLGEENVFMKTIKILCRVNAFDIGEEDYAPDDPNQGCYLYEKCEADFDSDGDVDGSDLALFAADFGRTNCCYPNMPPCAGDFDCDCDVDGSDLALFAADFGRTNCRILQ